VQHLETRRRFTAPRTVARGPNAGGVGDDDRPTSDYQAAFDSACERRGCPEDQVGSAGNLDADLLKVSMFFRKHDRQPVLPCDLCGHAFHRLKNQQLWCQAKHPTKKKKKKKRKVCPPFAGRQPAGNLASGFGSGDALGRALGRGALRLPDGGGAAYHGGRIRDRHVPRIKTCSTSRPPRTEKKKTTISALLAFVSCVSSGVHRASKANEAAFNRAGEQNFAVADRWCLSDHQRPGATATTRRAMPRNGLACG